MNGNWHFHKTLVGKGWCLMLKVQALGRIEMLLTSTV